jgi:cobyrinic acid a,c-diamide synthase
VTATGSAAEGFVHRSVHASYLHLHLHWAGQPSIAAHLVAVASGQTFVAY